MKFLRILCLLPALVILLATCKEAGAPTDANGNPTGNVTTTLAGIVVDESGQPVSGVAIIANSKNAVTDKYGTFMIQNASVPGNRCVILCKKNGYFTGSRAEVPKSGGITELRLTLQSNAPGYTVNSSSGGTLTIGTASVKFPPSAFVTSDGKPFTGTVSVAAKHLDPSQSSFYNSFSGDMTARRTDGIQTELLSYGVLRVRLTDDAGNELKLAAGKTATLTYPIAASQQKTAPASMPLWYFDEALGMWKEEGVATKSGDVYSGEVAHFTDWNCDVPVTTGTVKGRVVCNNEGVSGIYVAVGQRRAITDSSGYFSCRVPMNTALTLSINPTENDGLTAPEQSVSAISAGEERVVTLRLTTCPAYISGVIADCNDSPIAGTIVVSFTGGTVAYFTTTGEYKVRVPSGVDLLIEATTYNGGLTIPYSAGAINAGDKKEIGRLVACENGASSEYTDVNLGVRELNNLFLSPDGSMLVVNSFKPYPGGGYVEVFDTKNGSKLFQSNAALNYNAINCSDDGSKLLVMVFNRGKNPRYLDSITLSVVNPRTGAIIQKFESSESTMFYHPRLLPNGSAVVVKGGGPDKNSMRMYSVATGLKIKDFSFVDEKESGTELELVGTRGSEKIILLDRYMNKNQFRTTQIIDWDIAGDKKTNDIIYDCPQHVIYIWSPDFSILAASQNGYVRDFYNTISGKKLSTIDAEIGLDYNGMNYTNIAVANDLTCVIQKQKFNDSVLPPIIYSITDGKSQKVLPTRLPMVKYRGYTYSANSQYLAGIELKEDKDAPMVVRIWKVK